MARIVWAVLIAVGFHAFLAVGIAVSLSVGSSEDAALPELDLSSVELSLAREESEAPPMAQLSEAEGAESSPNEQESRPPSSPPEPTSFPLPPDIPPEMANVMMPDPPPEAQAQLDLPEPETGSAEPEPDAPDDTAAPRKKAQSEQATASDAAPPPAPAPQQAELDAPPQVKQTIKPNYPRESRLRGEEGVVLLELQIDAHGKVSAVQVVTSSGFPALDEAAIKAAKKAHFTPARIGEKSVPATARLPLTFRLNK